MSLLQSGFDTAVIALWLGHADIRSTGAYLHADITIKQRALERMTTADAAPGRYKPGDKLLPSSNRCNYADPPTRNQGKKPTAIRPPRPSTPDGRHSSRVGIYLYQLEGCC